MTRKQVQTSKETQSIAKNSGSEVTPDLILMRLEQLEGRCSQLETTLETALKDVVTIENLAACLTGSDKKSKTRKRTRAKREWSPEEKAAFHERMVAARKAKEKARQDAPKAESTKK